MENLQTYKKELISDLIINGVPSSIELEKRLDRLIVLAQQPELLQQPKPDERIGKLYKNIEGLFGFTIGNSYECIEIDNDDNLMIFIDDEGDKNGSTHCDSHYFELVSNESINPKKLVKNNWYIITSFDNIEWLVKFDYLNRTKIFCSLMYAISENYNVGRDWFPYGIDDTIRKATREEVVKYFPQEF